MTPGTVIAIPAEVKHWHGAAKDSWFQHLTYHKDVQDGASNEWLEPVTDDIYDILQQGEIALSVILVILSKIWVVPDWQNRRTFAADFKT